MTKHKCFISFKKEDEYYKEKVQKILQYTAIDKSLDESIDSNNPDYIMEQIRKEYLSDSTVTIFLIGKYSAENLGLKEQQYIKRELQASLYNGKGNTRSGVLGVVLPEMELNIFNAVNYLTCTEHDRNVQPYYLLHSGIVINEFSKNYYMQNKCICKQSEYDRYCILVKWNDFIIMSDWYIEKAFQKRESEAAKNVVIFPN